MNDLVTQLSSLGDQLDLADDDLAASERLVDQVLARLDEPARGWVRRPIQVAVLVAVMVAFLVAVPTSRRTLADWFGFDRARIELRPDLSVPERPPVISATPSAAGSSEGSLVSAEGLPAPGRSSTVEVNGVTVLVSVLDGTLDDGLITKSIGVDSAVREVDVGGRRGVWIGGAPHDVMYRDGDGEVVFERFAGNTLLWQVGEVLYGVEGFPTLADAVVYASSSSR